MKKHQIIIREKPLEKNLATQHGTDLGQCKIVLPYKPHGLLQFDYEHYIVLATDLQVHL